MRKTILYLIIFFFGIGSVDAAQVALETTTNPGYTGASGTIQHDDVRLTMEANFAKQQAMNTDLYDTMLTKLAASAFAGMLNSTPYSPTAAVDMTGAASFDMGQIRFKGDNVTNYAYLDVPVLTNNRGIRIGDYAMGIPAASALNGDGTIIFPEGVAGTGSGYVSTPWTYSDSPCIAGQYAMDSAFKYDCVASGNIKKTALTSWTNLTPTTYTLSLTILGESGADKVTVSGTDYTSTTSIPGLTSSTVSIVPSPDTDKTVVCTGDVTGTNPNYVANLSAANKAVTCTFSTSGAAFSYSDTFADSTLSAKGWAIVPDGGASQLAGYLKGELSSSLNGLLRTTSPSVLNGHMNINVLRSSASTSGQPGGWFRYIDSSNYSIVYCRPWANEIVYSRVVAGVNTDSATGTFALPANTEKLISIIFNGADVTVSYDGITILTGTDTNPLAGNMGPVVKEGSTLAARVADWFGESL